MNQIIRYILVFEFTLISSVVSYAQSLECPIDHGGFKQFEGSMYVHHNSKDGAVIISPDVNAVKAVNDGRIAKVVKHRRNESSLILVTPNTTIITYFFLIEVTVKEGALVKRGDEIGVANKNKDGHNEVRISCHIKSEAVDPTMLLNCGN